MQNFILDPKLPKPSKRSLWIYTIDPALSQAIDSFEVAYTRLRISWDDYQSPGPEGEYLEVIDYDASLGVVYPPADLNHVQVVASNGLYPSESDPRFHQQMVYAVGMLVIRTFESALGRPILWSPRYNPPVKTGNKPVRSYDEFVEKLRIYPHAMRTGNAYYDPNRKALLFGYFSANTHPDKSVSQLSGMVFTCLSFDIIAHEMTHAILDGIHRRYTESTNPDVAAFHEGFSDIVALLLHFTVPELIEHQLTRTRGKLDTDSVLSQLAFQFGQSVGHYGALRNAIGREEDGKWVRLHPRDFDLTKLTAPHERGSVLVAAVFDAFIAIYNQNVADLLRLASDGTGILREGTPPPELVGRLAKEASTIAAQVLRMCIRALDYCPSIDITFGEFLRALLTADYELVPDDPMHYRVAFIEAFRKWHIMPNSVRTMGEDDLRWMQFGTEISDQQIKAFQKSAWRKKFKEIVNSYMNAYEYLGKQDDSQESKPTTTRAHFEWSQNFQRDIHQHLNTIHEVENYEVILKLLGLEPNPSRSDASKKRFLKTFQVHSIRPTLKNPVNIEDKSTLELVFIINTSVTLDRETLEEIHDPKVAAEKRKSGEAFKFRGGSTIIYNVKEDRFSYIIRKNIQSPDRRRAQRDFEYGNSRSLYFSESEGNFFQALHASED